MAPLRGLLLASGAFAAAFALHIVGGATGQGWLFAVAVALIFALATGFPIVALLCAGRLTAGERNLVLNAGFVAGVALTAAALWAANGRAFAWWTFPAALLAVFGVSITLRALPIARPATTATRHVASRRAS